MLGAGTILDGPTAALFIAADSDFIVAPTLSAEVASICNRRAVPYLPGCFTPTEVSEAQALGCELIKLFPQAAIDGPAWLESVLRPMPWSRLVPTGCPSDAATLRRWFAAGAAAVGVGPDIFTPARLADRDVPGMARALRGGARDRPGPCRLTLPLCCAGPPARPVGPITFGTFGPAEHARRTPI